MATAVDVRFPADLPDCCSRDRLRLPQPVDAFVDVHGGSRDTSWRLGLDEWFVRVGVTWDGDGATLANAVRSHVGRARDDDSNLTEAVLATHGLGLDEEGIAWVSQQDLIVANLGSDLNHAAGRRMVWNGRDLLDAADDAAGDLEAIAGPLAPEPDDDSEWHPDVVEAWPDAVITRAVILLRAVHVTPVMRGHRLGAWTAAQSIALFDQGASLVATKAAPLARRDAVPDVDQDQRELTSEQTARWSAEQGRLAQHWRAQLGFVPLRSEPTVLTWHTSYLNETIKDVLGLWA